MIHHRCFFFLRVAPILLLIFSIFQPQSSARAAVTLTITPNAWNVIGLDSNNPAIGPYRFPIGAKICSSVDTTNVVVNFVWDDSTNATDIYLRSGSLTSMIIPSIAAGTTNCKDAYFEVEVNRTASPAPYNKARRYHITATDSSGTVSTVQPRELFVEHLISQNRNAVTNVKYGVTLGSLASVPAGGAMSLMVGSTYYIELYGGTATQGYNQFEEFINFPNTIFQILSVSTTYSADNNIGHVPNPNPGLYADACTWDNDPNSPTYRSCIGGDDKAGGSNVVTTYQVKIISGGGTTQTLNTLLYDFSGSSYHYNADYSSSSRIAYIIDPSVVTISKSFSPKAIAPGGNSVMTIKLTNPTTQALTGINFTDAFPGGMTLANTTTTNTCAGSLTDNSDGTLSAGDPGIRLSGGTLSGNSVCTIIVNVTVPAGTYPNTTGPLYINTTTNTGNTASDTLTASSAPACIPGQTLVRWTMPAGASAPPDTAGGAPTTNNTGFTATAYHFPVASQSVVSGSGSPDTTSDDASWETWGYKNAGGYVEFVVDTRNYSNVQMGFMVYTDSSTGPNTLTVTYSTSSGSGTLATYNGATLTSGAWNTKTLDLSSVASTTGATAIQITGTGANNDNSGADAYFNDIYFTGCSIPAPAPTISKAFLSNRIIKGSTSTLRFTLNNTAAGNRALSGIAFTDVLPVGLSISDSSTSQCGGTLTTIAATRTITLANGSLAAGASCNFDVTVTGVIGGQYDNVTGYVSSTQSGTSTNYATAALTVIVPPVLAKSFSPTSIFTGNASTLTFTINNPNLYDSLSGIGFTDTLPAGLTAANGTTTSLCGSGSLVISNGSLLTFSGGSLAANSICSFSVTVTGAVAGTKNNTTTAITSTEGGTGNTGSASLVVSDQIASLDLTKQVSATGADPWSTFIGVPTGGNVYYRFKVYNSGDLPFSALSVTDPTLAGTSADPASCNWAASLPLAPGDTAYCIKGPIVASGTPGSFPNTATAHGTYASGTKDSSPSTATYATPKLTLTKNATESYFIEAGDVLHYTFNVSNSGFVPLVGPIIVADDKATDESCPAVMTVGDLDAYFDPGESISCTATYMVTGADVTATSVMNTAFASAGGITSNAASKTVSLAPDLTITKVNSTGGVAAIGRSFTWTVTVSNGGSSAAAFTAGQTIFSDPLPAGPTYGAPSAGGFSGLTNSGNISCSVNSSTLACTASGATVTIGAGGSFAVALTVTPTSPGSLANVATVDPDHNIAEIDETNDTGSDTVTVIASPSISKAFGTSSLPLNGTTTLSFTITNPNTGTTLTGVAFTDVLPAGLTIAPSSSAQCGGTLTSTAPDTISLSGASIDPNGTCNLSVTVTGTTAGDQNNTTSAVTSTNGGTGNTASASITVVAPPSIAKSFAASSIALNGTTTLTFTITNPLANTVSLTGVSFTDTYPAGLQNSATPNASTTCTGGTVTAAANGPTVSLSGATIAINSSCTVTVTVAGTTAGTKTNNVTVSSSNGGTGNISTAKLGVLSGIKTVAATSEDSSSDAGAPRDVLIGEIVRYHLVIDLPEGTTTNLQVVEGIVANLAYMNDGSTRIAFVCNSGAACASSSASAIGSGPVISGNSNNITPTFVLPAASISGDNSNPYTDGVDPTFSFGNVTNNDNDSDAEYLVIEFNSLIRNTSVNQDGNTRGNTFKVNINGSTVATSTDTANSRINIIEPAITVAKSVTTAPIDAGDAIAYQLQITNTGNAPAFDIAVTDPLSAALTGPVSVSVSATGGSCSSTPSNVGGTYIAPNVIVTMTCLAAGGTATININAFVSNSTQVGSTISNTASLTYTSLPGTGTVSNLTGSTTPGASGDTTGERNGSGGTNDYAASSTVITILTVAPSITKQLTTTSAAQTSGTDVAIGEELTYDLLIAFPEGTTSADMVFDDLPTGLALVSGTPQVITTSAMSGGVLTADFNGTIGTQSITTVTGDGGSVQLDLTNVVVTGDNDATNNTILLRFNTKVSDVTANQAGTTLSNTATNRVGAGAAVSSNTVALTVVEPSITFGKMIVSLPASLSVGEVVHYQISYVNATGATVSSAMDVHITDTLPAQLALNLPVTITLAGGAAGVTDASAGNSLDLTVVSVPAGGSVTIDYAATIQSGVTPGQVIGNTADSTWTSLSGTVTGERTGADGAGGALDDYAATSTQTFTISSPDLSVVKTDGASTYTPGSPITYTVTVNNSGNATAASTITDTFPLSLTSISWTCSGTGSASCSASGSGNLNDSVSIPAGESVTYTINATVLSNVTGNLANTATATLSSGIDPTPGNNSSTDTDTPNFIADLEITKADGITNIGVNGTTTYTVVVTNHGPSDVHNAVFTDPAVAGLNVTNVTCGSSNGGAICPTVGNTTVALMQGAGIVIPTLPSGGSVTFAVNATATATTGPIANTANIALPAGVSDPGIFSNSATDTDNIVEIIAVDDLGSTVNGTSGGQSLVNVLTNDTLNGNPATLATITLTQVSTTNPGVTLNVATGAVNVALGTAAGIYTVTYQICDQANPPICDTATVSVPVVVIDAVDDTGSAVNGATGGQALANVLTNDTLNGNPATLANVSLTQVSTTNLGVTLNTATGAVNVGPATPAGSYTITYRICDQVNPSICDTATVTVPVSAAPIVATDDSASGVNGVTGATAVLNVLDNDTLNGLPVAPIDVMLTQTIPDPSGALTVNPNGTIDVAPGISSGTYQLTYQICEVLNPTNCATAVARATVVAPASPVAEDDGATTPFNTPVTLSNITANDTAFGAGNSIVINTIDLDPSTSNQQTSFTDSSGNQWSVNTTTGQVAFTPASNFTGTATIPYSVQDASGQTATANISVTVEPPASLGGKVFNDADLNGIQGPNESGMGAIKVDLYDKTGATLIATTTTASDGSYSFTNFTPGEYLVLETDPAGHVSTTSNSVTATVSAGSSATVNFGDYTLSNATLSSIVGTVFDDANANGMQDAGETVLSGVTIELKNNAGAVVATTTTNASGGYSFSNLAAGLYIVTETDPTGYVSTTLNNVAVNLSSGTLATVNFGDQINAAAQIADPAVTKFGSPSSAAVGSVVVYTLTVGNNGNTNATDVALMDTKPSFLDIISISISPNPGLSPVIAGNTFTINFGTVTPTDFYIITVLTRVNSLGQPPGGANNVSLTTSSLTDRASNNTFSAALPISAANSTENISYVRALPNTGFAPGVISDLSHTPQETYLATNDVTLEIPALGIKIPIVGVPLKNGTWNVSWLGEQAGWLQGTAFPSWNGNSVLTGHVYLANGLPGPFVNLTQLKYGDKIIVHAYGQKYTFEVRVNRIVEPNDASALRHQEKSWVTLLTCKEYDEKTNSYRKRVVVQAVLVSVAEE